MKKVLLSLLTIVLLGGCNRGVISSNISASISSSTTISSSSSSDKEISIPEKTSKDYLQSALTSLFLLNNYCEIKHIKNEVETTSSIYYDFTKNIYQYNYDSSYLTYKDSKIYFDNDEYHYYINSNEFNGYTLITSIIALEYIDLSFLEINKEGSNVSLSYETNYSSITFNIKEGLMTSLKNIEITMLNSSLTLTPKKVAKGYHSIDKNNHKNVFETIETLNSYLDFFNNENIKLDFNLDYKDIKIDGNITKENNILNGLINYNYLESNFSINIIDDTYKFNDLEVDYYTLIQNVMFNIDQNVLDELLSYTYNLLDSSKDIEGNKLIFTNDNFNETITFNSNNMIITFATLNLEIKCQEL